MDHLLAAVGNGALSCTFAVGTARTAVNASTAVAQRSLVQLAKCGAWGEHPGNMDPLTSKMFGLPGFLRSGSVVEQTLVQASRAVRRGRQVQIRNCSKAFPKRPEILKSLAGQLCLVGVESP